ncbi:class A beta-lactamase-related serine hydrolase [Tardiphaga alba]|uniref:Class A beta-lactamase-related serine hydrolase n=1 Tax=Tardiphaga alba TaxID=340268 RepID=A0ABX8AHR5_9BRAD|nr:class A beta-lactamase-related serine hydrolase [Tardiphaga alba]
MTMDSKDLDQLLGDAVNDHVIPGVGVMVSGPDKVHYCGVFGQKNVETADPIARDTIYKVSSWTKAITTTAFMQFVERGDIRLDQPVSSLIPAFKDIQVLDGFDGERPRLRKPVREVTLAHLASHSSGIAYEFWSEKKDRYSKIAGVPESYAGRNAKALSPLSFDPGEQWAYGTGIDWLGEIVEILSGERVDHYLNENVFRPLDMVDTAFSLNEEQQRRLATVHTRRGDDGFTPIAFDWPNPGQRILCGHGLYSSLDDYTKFLQMFLNNGSRHGKQVLSPASVEVMKANQIGDVNVGVMRSTVPHLSLDAEFFPGMTKKHSVGFQITTEEWEGMRSAGSLSWAGLLNLFYWWDPARSLAVTFASQLLPFQDRRVMDLFVRLEKAIYKTSWPS